jgi:hypothetical protein
MDSGEKVTNSSTMTANCLQQFWLRCFEQNPTNHYSTSGGHAPQEKFESNSSESHTVTQGIWRESDQQQHHKCELPPAVLAVIDRAEPSQLQ